LALALDAPRSDISNASGGGRTFATGGWIGAQRVREDGQPLGLRRRLVVDDVVDARCASLERGDGR
jgi:hypothetical protein